MGSRKALTARPTAGDVHGIRQHARTQQVCRGYLGRGAEEDATVSKRGAWIANCLPSRVERIQSASIFHLEIGPPKPNQLQTFEDLVDQGLVGLYKGSKKKAIAAASDQARYLSTSDFSPSPGLLVDILHNMDN